MKITLSETLFNQTQQIAQQLHLSPDEVVALAVEQFLQRQPAASPENRRIQQGDLYWVQLEKAGIPHPQVVLQMTVLNQSRIQTVVVCGLTTNLSRAHLPGNILLEAGEANLPKPSLIEVSKVSTVAKTQLGDYIGSLSESRLEQIFAGMRFLQRAFGH